MRDRTELRLQALLGTAYMHAKSWGAPEVEAAYSEAARLSDAAESGAEGVWILWGIWVYHHVRGRIDDAYQAGERIRELADSSGDPEAALIADMVALQTRFYTGRFSESLEYCASFLRGYAPERHRNLADAYSNDLELVCLVHQAIASYAVGQFDRAAEISRRIDELAGEIDHPYSAAWASTWGAVPDLLLSNTTRVAERVRYGHRIAEENDYAYVSAMATMLDGWVEGRLERTDGVSGIEAGLDSFRETGAEIVVPFFETLRAELLLERQRPDEAVAVLEDARARIARWGERWQEAEVWRVEAKALIALNDVPAAVETRFGTALDVARRQGALGWELRAAADFAAYLCAQRRPDEARSVLEPILDALDAGVGAEGEDLAKARRILSAAEALLVG
jgi:predicted ATPase